MADTSDPIGDLVSFSEHFLAQARTDIRPLANWVEAFNRLVAAAQTVNLRGRITFTELHTRLNDWRFACSGHANLLAGIRHHGPEWEIPDHVEDALLRTYLAIAEAHNVLRGIGAQIQDALRAEKGNPGTVKPKRKPATIWRHGDCAYSIDGVTPLRVPTEHDDLLTAFLENPLPMETRDLEDRSGVTNASRAMKSLKEWGGGVFGAAIRLPQGKSNGGFFARVRAV